MQTQEHCSYAYIVQPTTSPAVPPIASAFPRAPGKQHQLVLTSKGFPSFFFIALSQFTSTCLVVSLARLTGHVKVRQDCSMSWSSRRAQAQGR